MAKATGRDVASFAGIVEFASRKISEEAEAYSDLAVRLGFIGNEGKRGGTGLRIVGDEALSAALGVRTLSIEADNLLASLSRLPASADPIAGRIAAGANNAAAAPPPADPVIRLPRIEGLDGSDKTADTVRTFAEVVKALRKELAALDADQVVGLATPFETARAKATAFEAAIREANRTAGAGAPQVRALAVEMKALEAAANADAVRGFDAAGGALALHAPQYAAQVDALVQSLFRARLSADEAALGVAALDRVVPVAAVNAEGLATAAERAAEAFEDLGSIGQASARAVAAGVDDLADAISYLPQDVLSGLFGGPSALEVEAFREQTDRAKESLREAFAEGRVGAAGLSVGLADLDDRLAAFEARAGGVATAFRTLGGALVGVFADVARAILAATVKLVAFRALSAALSFVPGGGGFATAVGGILGLPSAAGAVSSALAPVATKGAPAALGVAAAPKAQAGFAFGAARQNRARGVLEIPYDMIGPAFIEWVGQQSASGAGSPFAGGVVTG